jgi:alginate O-acetyltransferase complex protein AlgI
MRGPWLFLASYVFYGWWNPLYLLLIAYSTALDYYVVAFMSRSTRRKTWLSVSIINNLFLLGFFKYGQFITDNINALLASTNAGYALNTPDITLPVGISFFVFQSMSYTIDYYRGNIERETSLLRYATFVSFFPQLVAGPIERASHLLPQLANTPKVTQKHVSDGLSLFVVGLFKKAVMADYLALYVDQVYANPAEAPASALALATFAFAWQIYFDFSGYTDMARGVARMMGYDLMLNFRNPYLATDLGDFWSRWHISLSTWFRDYVYIPLGGNRLGSWAMYGNIFLTMVISGLWHGAAWTFIIWGALHAIGRMATRELERSEVYRERVPKLCKQVLVFGFVCFTWIFFRAANVDEAWLIVTRIFNSSWFTDPAYPFVALAMIASIWAYQFIYDSNVRKVIEFAPVKMALVVLMLLCVVLFSSANEQAFIYFQF